MNPPQTETTHTPGPWMARGSSILANLDGEQVQVALMSRTQWCGKLSEHDAELSKRLRAAEDADARLIASAPELLAALEHAHTALRTFSGEENWCQSDSDTLELISAAIAKATAAQ